MDVTGVVIAAVVPVTQFKLKRGFKCPSTKVHAAERREWSPISSMPEVRHEVRRQTSCISATVCV